jgi:dihydrofolate reductase
MRVALIVAVSENNVIGANNDLPWHLPVDLAYFKKMTLGKPVIMGRKTFESINCKPLPNRPNIIVTRDSTYPAPGCTVVSSLPQALRVVPACEEAMIVGGSVLFQEALFTADRIYLTRIHHYFEGDVFFPAFDLHDWSVTSQIFQSRDEKNMYDCTFYILDRKK